MRAFIGISDRNKRVERLANKGTVKHIGLPQDIKDQMAKASKVRRICIVCLKNEQFYSKKCKVCQGIN